VEERSASLTPVGAERPDDRTSSPFQERSIGAILVEEGKLSLADAERIMITQKREGLRFGDVAIRLGLVTEADIQRALSLQYDYPYLAQGDERISREVVAAHAPFSKQVEGLRALRSQLTLRWFGSELNRRALAIVSPDRGDGRSFLAANLAVLFAQLGERTLLIDADLRHSRQHELFKISNRLGLSSLLVQRANGEATQDVAALPKLSVMPAGAVPPNPVELLESPAFSELLQGSAQRFDVVIVDTPAAKGHADAQTISARTGAALLVVRKNSTRARDASDLHEGLRSSNAVVVGSVLAEF
jgi:chain length determinant protein tyrosine kinase EpsG